jgi:hypothetical protein
MHAQSEGLDKVMSMIRNKRGMSMRVAEACGIQRAAVYQWKQVPLNRIHIVAEVLGLKPEQIRPDFFQKPVKRRQKR